MKSINKIILVGHLAADPESTPSKSGRNRVSFPLATHREQTSEGIAKDVTDYHRIVAWDALGEACTGSFTKGSVLYVEGQILNRAYEVNGERRYSTEIHADVVTPLSWKKKDNVASVSLESPEPAVDTVA